MNQISAIAPKSSQIVLVANKKDLETARTVSVEEGRELAAKYHIPFFETSAFSGENVNQAFEVLGRSILASLDEELTAAGGKSGLTRVGRRRGKAVRVL